MQTVAHNLPQDEFGTLTFSLVNGNLDPNNQDFGHKLSPQELDDLRQDFVLDKLGGELQMDQVDELHRLALKGDLGDNMKAFAERSTREQFRLLTDDLVKGTLIQNAHRYEGILTQHELSSIQNDFLSGDANEYLKALFPDTFPGGFTGVILPTPEHVENIRQLALRGDLGDNTLQVVDRHDLRQDDFYTLVIEFLSGVPAESLTAVSEGIFSVAELEDFKKDMKDPDATFDPFGEDFDNTDGHPDDEDDGGFFPGNPEEDVIEFGGPRDILPDDEDDQQPEGEILPPEIEIHPPFVPDAFCVRIGAVHGNDYIKSDPTESPVCEDAVPICWEASTQFGTPYLSNITGPEYGAQRACNKLGGQGVFMIKNNADMYRLWRYLFQIGERTNFAWIHGFRTNVHNGFVSLDDYDENGHFCAAFVNFNPKQFGGGQVFAVPCDRADIHYVCDDVHYIRYINYYHPTPSGKPDEL